MDGRARSSSQLPPQLPLAAACLTLRGVLVSDSAVFTTLVFLLHRMCGLFAYFTHGLEVLLNLVLLGISGRVLFYPQCGHYVLHPLLVS